MARDEEAPTAGDGAVAAAARVHTQPEKELPGFAKGVPRVTWVRPSDILQPDTTAASATRGAGTLLDLPEAPWSIREVRRNALVDSDWFVSGLCCAAAAAPHTLRLVFRDADAVGGGEGPGDAGEGGVAQGVDTEQEGIGPRVPAGLVNVSMFWNGAWATTQVHVSLPAHACTHPGFNFLICAC